MTNEQIARICHELNRAYCQELGDHSHCIWGESEHWVHESAEEGVAKLRDGVVFSPQQSHESWMAAKVRDGWHFGPVKDPEALTHPCMVPYRLLPASDRLKDTLFVQTARALLELGD